MGPVGHPSGNIFLRPLLSSILSFLHAFGCRELGSGIAYHESGHHHFWAGTFASTGGRYIKISSGESVFFLFLFFYCLALRWRKLVVMAPGSLLSWQKEMTL